MISIKDIKSVSLFSNLEDNLAEKIIKIVVVKNAKQGDIIFLEGDEATGFYAVLRGMIKAYKISYEGKEQVLHIFKDGDIFGEVPVFIGKSYPACASCISDTTLLFFNKSSFVNLLKKEPDVALSIIGALSLKLRRFVNLVETISLKEVPSRLANYILAQSAREKEKVSFELDISKTLLSSIIGTIPETLSRVFKKFKENEVFLCAGNKITILDKENLALIASGEKKLA
jgi:CRP/FNR family transcriptional regulator